MKTKIPVGKIDHDKETENPIDKDKDKEVYKDKDKDKEIYKDKKEEQIQGKQKSTILYLTGYRKRIEL